ncbi:MAG: hypothetical protein ING19_20440 [Azospirillum sp.]|nr:hypothetical protein [Azospirillum sp.]
MDAKMRLNRCRSLLEKRGVKDVKIVFGDLSEKPLSHVASDLAEALEAVAAGRFRELPKLQDSRRV